MDLIEIFFLLFIDSLYANLVVIPQDEFVFHSMDSFALHNKFIILSVVSIAGMFAVMFNYFLGRIIYKILINIEEQEAAKLMEPKRNKIKEFISKYYPILLLFSLWPWGGKFVQLVAGIYHLDFKKVMIICLICKVTYYGVLLILP